MYRAQSTATSPATPLSDTTTLAGASTKSHPSKPTQMPPPSLSKLKPDLESESSIISSTNLEPASTSSDDAGAEEAMKRKCELDASSVRPRKKRRNLPSPFVIHMKLRAQAIIGGMPWKRNMAMERRS